MYNLEDFYQPSQNEYFEEEEQNQEHQEDQEHNSEASEQEYQSREVPEHIHPQYETREPTEEESVSEETEQETEEETKEPTKEETEFLVKFSSFMVIAIIKLMLTMFVIYHAWNCYQKQSLIVRLIYILIVSAVPEFYILYHLIMNKGFSMKCVN